MTARHNVKYRLDATEYGAVAVCECGARVAAADRTGVLGLLADHERRGHPSSRAAAHAIEQARRLAADI